MELFIFIGVAALFGWLCSAMAKSRGRDPTGWWIGGFLFGIFAVIVLALIGQART